MESEATGIMATITASVVPVLTNLGVVPMLVVSCIFIALLTQVSHNVIVGALFTPILVPAMMTMGGNGYTLCWVMLMALNVAIATPAGSAYAGYLFAHPNLEVKDGYLFGTLFMIFGIIITLALVPLANILMPM